MRLCICRLCSKAGELCESHALPQSQFNYVLRKSEGKAIVVTDDEQTPWHFSSDTWGADVLCSACEGMLNRQYDSYALGVFRGRIASSQRGRYGVTFTNVDRKRLRMFFLSVLWRISIWHHTSYANVDLPYLWEHALHEALVRGRQVANSRFTVSIYRLRDSTAIRGFTHDSLRDFIMAPFARKHENFTSICFPFFGFLVETFLPRPPKSISSRRGVLAGASPVFMAPYQEVLAVPEIMAVLVRGLQKHELGLSRVS